MYRGEVLMAHLFETWRNATPQAGFVNSAALSI